MSLTSNVRGSLPWLVGGCVGFALFTITLQWQQKMVRPSAPSEMVIALPVPAQLLVAAGDRYLAANLAVFRAVVSSTEKMTPDDFAMQGRIQADAAWLNPAHEDNYYLAAAILPWNGEIPAAQDVLARATDARSFDWQPPFYFAFNEFYFNKNPVLGAEWLRRAAKHAKDEEYSLAFEQIAASWVAKGPDIELAIRMHRDMAKAAKHKEFAAYLEKRVVRLENQRDIEAAARQFRERYAHGPVQLEDLVRSGLLQSIPADPFGATYVVDSSGRFGVREKSMR